MGKVRVLMAYITSAITMIPKITKIILGPEKNFFKLSICIFCTTTANFLPALHQGAGDGLGLGLGLGVGVRLGLGLGEGDGEGLGLGARDALGLGDGEKITMDDGAGGPPAAGSASSELPKSYLIQAQSMELTLPSLLKSADLPVASVAIIHWRFNSALSKLLIAPSPPSEGKISPTGRTKLEMLVTPSPAVNSMVFLTERGALSDNLYFLPFSNFSVKPCMIPSLSILILCLLFVPPSYAPAKLTFTFSVSWLAGARQKTLAPKASCEMAPH